MYLDYSIALQTTVLDQVIFEMCPLLMIQGLFDEFSHKKNSGALQQEFRLDNF